MRIITVSRQFGSGGREVGKRLSDILGWDYYDKEILEKLSGEEGGFDPDTMGSILMDHGWSTVPLTFRNSFSYLDYDYAMQTKRLTDQRELIRHIAEIGNDFIIVGQNADIILEDYHPFRVFVCADLEARLERCKEHEETKPEKYRLTEKEILKNIKKIDKNRSINRSILADKDPNDSTMYDLIVNAACRTPKQLSTLVAQYAQSWFEMEEEKN